MSKLVEAMTRDGAFLIGQRKFKGNTYTTFRCSCGVVVEKPRSNIVREGCYARCRDCGVQDFVEKSKSRTDIRAIRRKFLEAGCYPLFFSLPKGVHSSAPFICYCGNYDTWTISNQYRPERVVRCKQCAKKFSRRQTSGKWGRRGKRFYVWAEQVRRASNFTCAIDGVRGGDLEAHHLYNWADYPEFRFEISNGVAIRPHYHAEFHSIYGKGRNTPQQFAEYVQLIQDRTLVSKTS